MIEPAFRRLRAASECAWGKRVAAAKIVALLSRALLKALFLTWRSTYPPADRFRRELATKARRGGLPGVNLSDNGTEGKSLVEGEQGERQRQPLNPVGVTTSKRAGLRVGGHLVKRASIRTMTRGKVMKISGCGVDEVNGEYAREGENAATARHGKRGIWKRIGRGPGVCIFFHMSEKGSKRGEWVIAVRGEDGSETTLFTCASSDGSMLPPHSGWERDTANRDDSVTPPQLFFETQTARRSEKLIKASRKKSAASIDASMERKVQARRQRRLSKTTQVQTQAASTVGEKGREEKQKKERERKNAKDSGGMPAVAMPKETTKNHLYELIDKHRLGDWASAFASAKIVRVEDLLRFGSADDLVEALHVTKHPTKRRILRLFAEVEKITAPSVAVKVDLKPKPKPAPKKRRPSSINVKLAARRRRLLSKTGT